MTAEPDEAGETAGTLARDGGASIAYRTRQGHPELPGIVFLCGLGSDMFGTKATALASFAARRGQSILRFDYQGHGGSSGNFEDGKIGIWLGDALAAVDTLTRGRQIVVGSSMGGWIMLRLALARPDRIAALVGIACAADFTERLILAGLPETERRRAEAGGAITVPTPHTASGAYRLGAGFIAEARAHLVLDSVQGIRCPVRLFHGTADAEVPWRLSQEVLERLGSDDATLTLVKGGDHRLSGDADIARVEAAVAELTERHAARATRNGVTT